MIRRPPRSTQSRSSAASDVYKRQELILSAGFSEGDSFDYMFQSGDAVERVISQLFQANVSAMGFNLELIEVDRSAIVEAVYGDSPAEERPMFFGGWGWWPDYNDPVSYTHLTLPTIYSV